MQESRDPLRESDCFQRQMNMVIEKKMWMETVYEVVKETLQSHTGCHN
jgi:hypothetical protein